MPPFLVQRGLRRHQYLLVDHDGYLQTNVMKLRLWIVMAFSYQIKIVHVKIIPFIPHSGSLAYILDATIFGPYQVNY